MNVVLWCHNDDRSHVYMKYIATNQNRRTSTQSNTCACVRVCVSVCLCVCEHASAYTTIVGNTNRVNSIDKWNCARKASQYIDKFLIGSSLFLPASVCVCMRIIKSVGSEVVKIHEIQLWPFLSVCTCIRVFFHRHHHCRSVAVVDVVAVCNTIVLWFSMAQAC